MEDGSVRLSPERADEKKIRRTHKGKCLGKTNFRSAQVVHLLPGVKFPAGARAQEKTCREAGAQAKERLTAKAKARARATAITKRTLRIARAKEKARSKTK